MSRTSTGFTSRGLDPAYCSTERYSSERPTKDLGIGRPMALDATVTTVSGRAAAVIGNSTIVASDSASHRPVRENPVTRVEPSRRSANAVAAHAAARNNRA